LDSIADKYSDNCLTMLSLDFFNWQEKVYANHNDADRYRKQTITDQERLNHPEIVHEA